MDGAGFDAPVKGLAARSTRRRVLGRLGAAVGAAVLGLMVTGADADAGSCPAEAARTARGCRNTVHRSRCLGVADLAPSERSEARLGDDKVIVGRAPEDGTNALRDLTGGLLAGALDAAVPAVVP